MKKLLSIILILVMMLSLVSCIRNAEYYEENLLYLEEAYERRNSYY